MLYFCGLLPQAKETKYMRKVVDVKEKVITTNSGQKFVQRTTTILMPNGHYRHPVDYYDATPGPVRVTKEELERLRIPGYKRVL